MFPDYAIDAITNGVHAGTWTAAAVQATFDKHLPRWSEDNTAPALCDRHSARTRLWQRTRWQERRCSLKSSGGRGSRLREVVYHRLCAPRRDLQTRRPAVYGCGDDWRPLRRNWAACRSCTPGRRILRTSRASRSSGTSSSWRNGSHSGQLHIIYLADYEWRLGALLTGGVDLWLNNPQRPYEASGTSGMKAALNGVPSLSVLDGWWIEGCIEGVTGWAIEDHDRPEEEAASLYDKLESKILPLYYQNKQGWRKLMQTTIAMNGSFFNTQRMLEQYVSNAYYPEKKASYSAHLLEQSFAR